MIDSPALVRFRNVDVAVVDVVDNGILRSAMSESSLRRMGRVFVAVKVSFMVLGLVITLMDDSSL